MKNFTNTICAFLFVAIPSSGFSQLQQVKPAQKERPIQKEFKKARKIVTVKPSGAIDRENLHMATTISSIPSQIDYNRNRGGFAVEGVAGASKEVKIYNKVKWQQKGYNYVRTKEYDPITVTSESDGTWKAKIELPYRSVPIDAYDIRFLISAQEFPHSTLAPDPVVHVVRATMAPPTIQTITENSIHFQSDPGPGGMYPKTYTTISGTGIPNMNLRVNVGTEYQYHPKQYNRSDEPLTTDVMPGESKTVKIASNGSWSVKVEVPNPYTLFIQRPTYRYKLQIKVTQQSSAEDVSGEAVKKFPLQ